MADLLDGQGGLEILLNNRNIFECDKKPNVKTLAFPSGLHLSCSSHHFQGFNPFINPTLFWNTSGLSKNKLARSDKYQRKKLMSFLVHKMTTGFTSFIWFSNKSDV